MAQDPSYVGLFWEQRDGDGGSLSAQDTAEVAWAHPAACLCVPGDAGVTMGLQCPLHIPVPGAPT